VWILQNCFFGHIKTCSILVCLCLTLDLQIEHYSCDCIVITDMRSDVQEIFRMTPHEKQVMMFSATLSKDIRPVCKKFMQDVINTTLLLSQYRGCRQPN
jgi:hypothetical protein